LFYPSNNIFSQRSAGKPGGFSSAFRTAEDREVCRRWLRAGYRLAKAPDAVLAHAPQLTLARYWRQFVAYGEGAAKFHGTSIEMAKESLAFHLRVPALAAAGSQAEVQRRIALGLVAGVGSGQPGGLPQGRWKQQVASDDPKSRAGRESLPDQRRRSTRTGWRNCVARWPRRAADLQGLRSLDRG
jgi:hypothetical protein